MIRSVKLAAQAKRRAYVTPKRAPIAKAVTVADVRKITDMQTGQLLAALAPSSGPAASGQSVATGRLQYGSLPLGSPLAGGLFSGITYVDGKPYVLVLGPEHPEELTHDQFSEWLKTLSVDGCTDFVAGSKLDGMLLFTNLRKEFKQSTYWLEQHAEYSSDAWYQNFGNGFQYYWDKNGKFRCRAVRRLILSDSTF